MTGRALAVNLKLNFENRAITKKVFYWPPAVQLYGPPYTYAIEDTRHAHATRRPKIRGSHHQNLKL
jgi:hypothetical protein